MLGINSQIGELRTTYNDNYMAADGCIRGLRDKPLHIDVTIANPTGPSYLHNGNLVPNKTLRDKRQGETEE